MEPSPILLRPVAPADRTRIDAWLALPDVQRWWGSAATAAAEVRQALGSSSALCRMIELDGVAIGYAHAVDAGLWGADLPPEVVPGTWDVDLFIADRAHRGQGRGQAALGALVDEVFSSTLAVAVCVFVSVRNEAAVRAYEKAGFQWVRVWPDAVQGPSWMLVRERSAGSGGG